MAYQWEEFINFVLKGTWLRVWTGFCYLKMVQYQDFVITEIDHSVQYEAGFLHHLKVSFLGGTLFDGFDYCTLNYLLLIDLDTLVFRL